MATKKTKKKTADPAETEAREADMAETAADTAEAADETERDAAADAAMAEKYALASEDGASDDDLAGMLGDEDDELAKEIEAEADDLVASGSAFGAMMAWAAEKPLLTREEELELAKRAKEGDAEARNELVSRNLRYVATIARRYAGRGLSAEDLFQEGCIGLMKAVELFDHEKGYRFLTYATWWIKQSMTRAIYMKGGTIHLPSRMSERRSKLRAAAARLELEGETNPSDELVAKRAGLSLDVAREVMDLPETTTSLDVPVGEDGDATLGDLIGKAGGGPEAEYEAKALAEAVGAALGKLTEREREVVKLRFGIDTGRARTLEEVGAKMNVSRERIRQIEEKALRKLRAPKTKRELRPFYDG